MRRINRIVLISFLAIILMGCATEPNEAAITESSDSVTLGIAPSLNYLAIIAQEQGFFVNEGLDVVVTEFTSGTKARNSLFSREVDVGIVGLGPTAFASMERSDFKIFGSVSTHYDLYKIVARKDSGIQEPTDLIGKRIGTSQASSFHYVFHNFSLGYGFSEDDVELVFASAADQPAALASGEVDAISIREPFISEAIGLLGENSIVFSNPDLPANTLNLVAMDEFIQENPQVIDKVLRAMISAEEFVANNPSEAINIVAEKLEIPEEELQVSWDNTTLVVSLSQELILELENISQWAINQNLTDVTTMPNFLDFVYMNGLDSIKPEAITIIR